MSAPPLKCTRIIHKGKSRVVVKLLYAFLLVALSVARGASALADIDYFNQVIYPALTGKDVDGSYVCNVVSVGDRVVCNGANVTEIHLYFHIPDLSGTIPTEIGNLVSLGALYLFDNNIGGTIPTEIGNLLSLDYLRLDGNRLCGEVPPLPPSLSSCRLFLQPDLNCFNCTDNIVNKAGGCSTNDHNCMCECSEAPNFAPTLQPTAPTVAPTVAPTDTGLLVGIGFLLLLLLVLGVALLLFGSRRRRKNTVSAPSSLSPPSPRTPRSPRSASTNARRRSHRSSKRSSRNYGQIPHTKPPNFAYGGNELVGLEKKPYTDVNVPKPDAYDELELQPMISDLYNQVPNKPTTYAYHETTLSDEPKTCVAYGNSSLLAEAEAKQVSQYDNAVKPGSLENQYDDVVVPKTPLSYGETSLAQAGQEVEQ